MGAAVPNAVPVVVSAAVRLMGPAPRGLQASLDTAAAYEDEPVLRVADLVTYIRASPADDVVRREVHLALSRWDAQDSPGWAANTRHQTIQRRDRIYAVLQLDAGDANAFDELFPPYLASDPGFEISAPYDRWFDQEEQERLGFYWPRYEALLRDVEGWPAGNVQNLSRATKHVIERLGNPLAPSAAAHSARGLVVGYVQSGKTANFTGVIARAVDAGYRLIIVLTGMTKILREQTQRRVDRQLIGQELLKGVASGEFEYEGVPDWDKFTSYGGKPSAQGSVDWRRLTSLGQDYRRLGAGIGALHFEHSVSDEPANSAANLRLMPVRLIVAMKQVTPLGAMIKDLRQVARAGFLIGDIPTLIIDDESDQASINTKRPTVGDLRRRTAINKRIVELLELLPRAQYVGYTATPFANVFVDPNDALGIFPRDFIIGLDRPDGYMGAVDYHDFGSRAEGVPSKEAIHVRGVCGSDLDEGNLRRALDSYLLTGAIKLFRAQSPEIRIGTRHHTMLVHTSHRVPDHELMRDELIRLLDRGGYASGVAFSRLEELLRTDFREHSEAVEPALPFPGSLEELQPSLTQCWNLVNEGDTPALIVNGEKRFEDETPDFDSQGVWKIVVGGTKLSRGYTVEGLTVSYYRRTTRAADTLMQMGRWFGFRQNYRDLMRLFIGRAEPLGPKKTIDLYAAFGAICQDELDFREELLQYALPDDGSPPLRPMDVPPLVTQRFPDIRPTAPNRMFNAVQVSANFGGKAINPTLAPTQETTKADNRKLTRALFAEAVFEPVLLGDTESFRALCTRVDPVQLVHYLERYRFSRPNLMERQLAFLRGDLGDPGIERWTVIWPLLGEAVNGDWPLRDDVQITVIERYRFESGRFNVYTGSNHVAGAKLINGTAEDDQATKDTRRLRTAKTGAGLFYAVRSPGEQSVTVGFALYPPRNGLRAKTRWGLRRLSARMSRLWRRSRPYL